MDVIYSEVIVVVVHLLELGIPDDLYRLIATTLIRPSSQAVA